jgi:hypothetical protein
MEMFYMTEAEIRQRALLNAVMDSNDDMEVPKTWCEKLGVIPAIFLKAVIHAYADNGDKAFCRFSEPCDNHLYVPGLSWKELLGMDIKELRIARKKVAAEIKPNGLGTSDSCIEYWKDKEGRTWYSLNKKNLGKFWDDLYTRTAK